MSNCNFSHTPSLIYFTPEELERFIDGIKTCYSFPFIDGIEDYILEAILEYARGIDGVDPLLGTRSKLLYDVVDARYGIGWSVKSLQVSKIKDGAFELVIQRADIFKKAQELGFGELSKDSDPQELGRAIMKHWSMKVEGDAVAQNVNERRVFVLLKSRKPSLDYAIYEAPLIVHSSDELVWEWTNEEKSGLQGKDRETGRIVHRWYPSQKQLFESFVVPNNMQRFSITTKRLQKEEAVHLVMKHLRGQP